MKTRALELVAEHKLSEFIAPPGGSAVLEASGVVAMVSQRSSKLWIGRVRWKERRIVCAGRTYELPRSKRGRCRRRDESIHILRLPRAPR